MPPCEPEIGPGFAGIYDAFRSDCVLDERQHEETLGHGDVADRRIAVSYPDKRHTLVNAVPGLELMLGEVLVHGQVDGYGVVPSLVGSVVEADPFPDAPFVRPVLGDFLCRECGGQLLGKDGGAARIVEE